MHLFILSLRLLPWIPGQPPPSQFPNCQFFLCVVTTGEELEIWEGQSLKVPCAYEPQYTNHVKYWCWGSMREFCTSLARSDDPRSANPAEDKVSIFDDPVQLVFTVTMNSLKEEESGWYMCGVELDGFGKADVVAFTYITVTHGMKVVNSQLSGEEGSSVTVECFYSERYRESEKKWCRSGDSSSCLLTGSEGSYEDTSVAISDDRTRTFNVTFKKLQMRDTGWYWCGAGRQQITVHVLVTARPTTNGRSPAVQALCVTSSSAAAASVTSPPTSNQFVASLPPPKPIAMESSNNRSHIMEPLMACSSVMLFVVLAVFLGKMWKLHNRDPVLVMKARFKNNSRDVGDLRNTADIFINKDSQDVHMYGA